MDSQQLDYHDTSSAVQVAKDSLNMHKPTYEMTDDDIRVVCRWLAERAPDTVWIDGKPTLGRMGIGVMLFIVLSEFPDFYVKYGLAQFN